LKLDREIENIILTMCFVLNQLKKRYSKNAEDLASQLLMDSMYASLLMVRQDQVKPTQFRELLKTLV